MVSSFSIGLNPIIKKNSNISNILTQSFSIGLNPIIEKHGNKSNILVKTFSLGIVDGTPIEIRIIRDKLLK